MDFHGLLFYLLPYFGYYFLDILPPAILICGPSGVPGVKFFGLIFTHVFPLKDLPLLLTVREKHWNHWSLKSLLSYMHK